MFFLASGKINGKLVGSGKGKELNIYNLRNRYGISAVKSGRIQAIYYNFLLVVFTLGTISSSMVMKQMDTCKSRDYII